MFARTDRLLLRPVWREDGAALHEAIADPAIRARLPDMPSFYSPSDAAAFCAAERDPLRPELLIFARTRGAPRLIGGIGLRDEEDEATLGFWIRRDHWGLGFATEAGKAAVDIALTGLRLPRLTASHFADQPAAGHVLRKLGFRRTGRTARRVPASDAIAPSLRYVVEGMDERVSLAA